MDGTRVVNFLDTEELDRVSPSAFESTRPFPYLNVAGLLKKEGFERLVSDLPDAAHFIRNVGKPRRGGQAPHDRLSLEFADQDFIPETWREFISELRDERYRRFIADLFGVRKVKLRFHWHYTPTGCWVSPHTDSPREYGSQIFYVNDPNSWKEEWGGETLVLDDGGALDFNSAPDLSDFRDEIVCCSDGNYSSILKRTDHGWHAVRPIECPEGEYRRVFIVVVQPDSILWRARDRVIGRVKNEY